jgi:hypothetical protein
LILDLAMVKWSDFRVNLFKKYPAIVLILQCSFVGGLIMFVCMAVGEIFVNPQMFGAFLSRPSIWPWIFIESAIWLIPFMVIVLPLLKMLRNLPAAKSTAVIAGAWVAVGSLIVIGYKLTYHPDNWDLGQVLRADITFGWTIPCALILVLFIGFSTKYLERIRADV